ncbi:MAG TPA: acyltransferase [Sphingomicrobium sp.]|jgi:peptidoglycan/LPS O-acetylase OafA/YrhL|nr:acyltransferase [Sphingomicrobium sp.]
MRQGNERLTFHSLNGLRGVAAVAVVNAHLQAYCSGYFSHNVGLVVDFFFVLSGFVIAHAYERQLRDGLGAMRFMTARFVRLYPLYLVGLLLGATIFWLNWLWGGVPAFFTSLGMGLLMLPPPSSMSSNYYNLFPLNFAAWSLFYELIANFAFALLATRLTNRVLGIIIALAFGGLVLVGLDVGTLDQGVRPFQIPGGVARVMFSFFAGVALYRLWQVRPVRFVVPPVVLFVFLILPLLFKPAGQMEWIYDLAVISLYFPALILVGAQSRGGKFWTWVCATLGALSYPLYVLHVPMWNALKAYYDEPLKAMAPLSGLLMVVAFATIAWGMDAFFDYPLRRRLSRRLVHRPTSAGAPEINVEARAAF